MLGRDLWLSGGDLFQVPWVIVAVSPKSSEERTQQHFGQHQSVPGVMELAQPHAGKHGKGQ